MSSYNDPPEDDKCTCFETSDGMSGCHFCDEQAESEAEIQSKVEDCYMALYDEYESQHGDDLDIDQILEQMGVNHASIREYYDQHGELPKLKEF